MGHPSDGADMTLRKARGPLGPPRYKFRRLLSAPRYKSAAATT